MSRTSLKRWFGNRTMTSDCDVTNNAQQIQMTTLCHWMKTPHENFLRTPLMTRAMESIYAFTKNFPSALDHATMLIFNNLMKFPKEKYRYSLSLKYKSICRCSGRLPRILSSRRDLWFTELDAACRTHLFLTWNLLYGWQWCHEWKSSWNENL